MKNPPWKLTTSTGLFVECARRPTVDRMLVVTVAHETTVTYLQPVESVPEAKTEFLKAVIANGGKERGVAWPWD